MWKLKIEATSLRSKIARRIFLQFVVCAMLPIVVLTTISSRVMTSHLEDQANRRLRRTTKTAGMVVLGRLAVLESELKAMAAVLRSDSSAPHSLRWEKLGDSFDRRIDGAALVSEDGFEPLFGMRPPDSSFSFAEGTAPRSGEVRLAVATGADDRAHVLLALGLGIEGEPPSALVVEIDPDQLWQLDEASDLPEGAELLILDDRRRVLFTSLVPSRGRVESLLRAQASSMQGGFRWSPDGREQRGRSWWIFLNSQYDYPGWTIVVTEPAEDVAVSLAMATKILPLVILLCLLVVALLSAVQIRKSLVPIVSLREGTRRIAGGRLDTRITVDSDDEFSQLAASFNSMAERLGAQFRTLATLAEIDRQLLSTLDERRIVETLLSKAPERFGCDRVAVTLASFDRPDVLDTRVRADAGTSEERLAVVTDDERRRLFESVEQTSMVPGDSLPPHLAQTLGEDLAECLVISIRRNAITGCLSLGFLHPGQCTDEARTEAGRLADQAGIALSNARLLEQVDRVNWETLYALARAVDAHSPWTSGHSERVTSLALELARRLDVSEGDLLVLHKGGLLHDIGKIGVPSPVLDKPARLTEAETALMQAHVRIGANILEPISAYDREIPILLHHHERFDGTGYPDGLAGDDIPFLARVLAVADVFDALISDRPYRSGWEFSRVVEFIGGAAGTHFDPTIVTVFLQLMGDGAGERIPPTDRPGPLAAVDIESELRAAPAIVTSGAEPRRAAKR